jgi:hypothetical protein
MTHIKLRNHLRKKANVRLEVGTAHRCDSDETNQLHQLPVSLEVGTAPKRVSAFLPSQIAHYGRSDGFGVDVPVDAIRCCKPVGEVFLAST